ncbi:carboxypeptidase regulatory-like domain-containing protein [Luteitalea sp. TBR-22]|uniref:carboxypeptidase regulatory-like domain-containing protein n=1 Tax=Luteitalea sp. TBR-22 TaxID=2802971 RepID=UPI001EF5E42C|nr:carboxypeptidase regulatory-like domain-containing protein [Luteitalea sp. TBR-22]
MSTLDGRRGVWRRVGLAIAAWVASGAVAAAATFVVTSAADSGPGSFRQALLDAAANGAGPYDYILFSLPGPGPHVIQLATELPPIPGPVFIDGYSQTGAQANTREIGNDAAIVVQIDGGGVLPVGLRVSSSGVTVSGLSVTRFTTAGVMLTGGGSSSVSIAGNFIGLTPAGGPSGNGAGVVIGNAGGAFGGGVIGGPSVRDRNVISANVQEGIVVANDARSLRIVNNYIGTNPAGTFALGNAVGIRFHGPGGETAGATAGNNQIGSPMSFGNVVSGNLGHGIVLSGAAPTYVAANLIGAAADRVSLVGTAHYSGWASGGHGILIEAANGVSSSGHEIVGNLVRNNRLDGIRVMDGTGTRLQRNTVFWNGGLDIDLSGDGPTANDPGDGDTGPNGKQNFPVLTHVVAVALDRLRVSGTLESTPNTSVRLEFFNARGCRTSSHGGGEVYAGSFEIMTDSAGLAEFSGSITTPGDEYQLVSATATSSSGDSSEYSECGFVQPLLVELTGMVTFNGQPQAGVDVVLGGYSWGTRTTGSDGRYAFGNLTAGKSYTITPTLAGYLFTPTSTTLTPSGNAAAGFAATRAMQVTGRVRDLNGSPLAGVTVTLSGDRAETTMSDAEGRYTFDALAPGATYDVGVARSGFTFAPASRRFANLQADVTESAASFTATLGAFKRYFAEGATGFFDTSLALLNATEAPANVTMRFLKGTGSTVTHTLTMLPQSRQTVAPRTLAGLESTEFSTVVESDVPVVADRTMYWGATAYGSHAETSTVDPALTWYLAEGATIGGFSLFYLLQNPSASASMVKITYLRPAPAVAIERQYVVPPASRFNVWVNVEDAALAAAEVSAVVEVQNGVPIIAERAMYRDGTGQTFAAGHASAGITAPSPTWFLAEGSTGPYFDLFVLIANPGAVDADVTATFLLPDGTTRLKSFVVPARSRFTIWVDEEELPAGSGQRPLANTAVSTTIASTNGVPLIVERSMWWPGSALTWHEGHNSAGAPSTGTRWALAEGALGGATDTSTYILVANTSPTPGLARVTLYFEDGTTADRSFPLAPTSRLNVDVFTDFPVARGRRFGAVIESIGATPAQLVVERAMYSNAEGVTWAAGTDALATRLR